MWSAGPKRSRSPEKHALPIPGAGATPRNAKIRAAVPSGSVDQILVAHPQAPIRETAPPRPASSRTLSAQNRASASTAFPGVVAMYGSKPYPLQAPRARLDAGGDHVHRMPVQADEPRLRIDPQQQLARYRAVPRLLSQYRFFPRRSRYEPTIRSIVSRTPAIAASGITGGSSPRFADSGAPSISDHTVASCAHSAGQVRLRRAGQIRVRIEQEPQQRRARSPVAQHEHRVSEAKPGNGRLDRRRN